MLSSSIIAILAFGVLGGVFGAATTPMVLLNETATTVATVSRKVEVAVVATTLIPITAIVNQTTIKAVTKESLTSTTARPWTQLTIVDYFIKVVRGELLGARKCKKNHDCGAGLRCNTLLNWCAPWDAPTDWQELANNCTLNADCGDLYHCLLGRCHFIGPRICKSVFDCAVGIANVTFDCIDTEDLEKRAIIQQLGRSSAIRSKVDLKPHRKSNSKQERHDDQHEVEIESDEVEKFGPTAEGDHLTHGKRCWAQCKSDADCGLLRFPQLLLKENIACCNGYCTRKQSCVMVPEMFRPMTAMPMVPAAAPILVKSKSEATPIQVRGPKTFF